MNIEVMSRSLGQKSLHDLTTNKHREPEIDRLKIFGQPRISAKQLHGHHLRCRSNSRYLQRSSKVLQILEPSECLAKAFAELQVQYSQYKETLQTLAQKIGDVEQESEEHK